ncbi:dATP/dGTP diphosphohydrolase domain-containing protein [Luteibacter sp. ME-Dv--P-043b]|uniref:dATP/dGTP diphosphohydrolase domain-containing protein n=1 Tax=Luteibacter sp. ME-Dv--P-043b TaxID=3040291 RepID=UPI0025531B8E|nr:dATP/dGTP diphosphohydrolase domain-containing protein [Luteibacter sp. ME-Dv--P-043b]
METVTAPLGIGDVNSDARGSGARFNTGKPPFELLPLRTIMRGDSERHSGHPARLVLDYLGDWQAGYGEDHSNLHYALDAACDVERTFELSDLADAAHVFDYGRRKYAEWNWAKGMSWSIPLACAVRHCLAALSGEETDPESGQPHMAHVKCNIIMLMLFAETFREGDDRPVKWLNQA